MGFLRPDDFISDASCVICDDVLGGKNNIGGRQWSLA
jgi:hypothetical protein